MKLEIDIELKIKDKTVKLTLEEAKMLKDKLDEMFTTKYTYIPIQNPWQPYITWSSSGSQVTPL